MLLEIYAIFSGTFGLGAKWADYDESMVEVRTGGSGVADLGIGWCLRYDFLTISN